MPTAYDQTFRRALLDMHIPDWDRAFLGCHEPAHLADLYAGAGITGALCYAKSHLGLHYWPAPAGAIHRAARERDLFGELCTALRARGIAPAAYYSVIFDNWAVENYPDWAIVPATTSKGVDAHLLGPRYGTCCANQPGYREYELGLLGELVHRYTFDALWIDMAFWTAVCVCDACRQRYRDEEGAELPDTLDWAAPQWLRFQNARERWIEEFYVSIVKVVRAERPGLPITHNLAPALGGWLRGQNVVHARHDSFVAGDLYGGTTEQSLVAKLMLHLGARRPAEFMTSRTRNLRAHVQVKSEHEMRVQAFGALAHGEACLFIDAIDPIGTLNPAVYARIGKVFADTARYEPFLGGQPVEDVALYYSDASCIDPRDDGRALADITLSHAGTMPHRRALTGAARTLGEAHLPFGVVTRNSLAGLARYRVVVLPEVLRLSADEVAALRGYVEAGGHLYASGRTSLLDAERGRQPDFALADVFGCHLAGIETGAGVFLRPEAPILAHALAPQDYLACGFDTTSLAARAVPPLDLPRLATRACGTALARLTLPYAYPASGTMAGHDFASIHSSPPWEHRANPVTVTHEYGRGRAIYSALPLETCGTEAADRAFVALVRDLLDGTPRFEADAHPQVRITAFDQPECARVVFSILRHAPCPPDGTTAVRVRWRPQGGARVRHVETLPEGGRVPWRREDDGSIRFDLAHLALFEMVQVRHETGS